MELKYFKEGITDKGLHGKKIILDDRVFSIEYEDEFITFLEECDGYFAVEYSKEQAIELLQEAIAWIQEQ